MKKLLFVLFMGLTFNSAYSQDVITLKNGEDIQSKILEVTTTDVKYKRFDNLEGPTYSMSKSDILIVRYENGTKDVFNEANSASSVDMCQQAKLDSKEYYRGERSGAGWTCATTILFSPLIGAIPGVICASSEPSYENLNVPNPELMKDNNYSHCYREQAYKTKKAKIWTNYAIGSGVWLALLLLF